MRRDEHAHGIAWPARQFQRTLETARAYCLEGNSRYYAKGNFAGAQIKVVNRELVAVLTQATLTDAEMLQAHPDAAYLLSITEQQIAKAEPGQEEHGAQQGLNDKSVRIGICAVDVATARILLGQW